MAEAAVPAAISEQYYQISEAILGSFPKYRPPLDLFVFKENIKQLVLYCRKETRLSNEQVEEVHALCAQGDLFVSRADHHIYSKHIVKQLDLVLVDENLTVGEVVDVSIAALSHRLDEFFAQPVKPVFQLLHDDLMVVTEYLWADLHRLKSFMRRLHRGEYALGLHSLNTMIVGLWLYAGTSPEMKRKDFDEAALGLLLHDCGMAKVPAFITAKAAPLKMDEKDKIPPHALAGAKMLHKLELASPLVMQAVLEHHEREDGSGYPQHLKTLSPFGRLTAVADSFSAMIQSRPYAEGKDPLSAAKELSASKGRYDLAYAGKLLADMLSGAFGKFV